MHSPNIARLALLPILLSSLLLTACGGGGGGESTTTFGGGSSGGGFNTKPGGTPGGGGEPPVIVDDTPDFEDIVVTQGNTTVRVPGRALLDVIEVSISAATLATPLPAGLTQVGSPFNVNISAEDQAQLNGPVATTVTYDPATVTAETHLLALYFNGTRYEPVTILARDEQANTITFDSRRFSTFVLAESDGNFPADLNTGFDPALHGWSIANFGTYFAPGGNSFAMAGYAVWFFEQNGATPLTNAYTDLVAQILAARVQVAQGESWGAQDWRESQAYKDSDLALLLKANLNLGNPVVMLLGDGTPALAAVVYGYDDQGFFFYDPNLPGESQFISFDGNSFGSYNGLTATGYAALSSFGRDSDFATLAAEADTGFPGSENLSIDEPIKDALIDARETQLSGSFLNDLANETSLYVEVKGVGRQLSVSNGTFDNVIEISSGTNTIVALAGVDASQENNWFRDAPTLIREVTGTLPPAKLLVTLTWEQNETDVDLYITEPDPDGDGPLTGETMWYGGSRTSNGLELDIDDTTGFGPEHGTLEIGGTNRTLDGEYLVRLHYFSDDGLNVDATGRITIVINEGEVGQKTLSLRFRIADDNSSDAGPGGTGTSWLDIARVDVVNGVISTDFPEN